MSRSNRILLLFLNFARLRPMSIQKSTQRICPMRQRVYIPVQRLVKECCQHIVGGELCQCTTVRLACALTPKMAQRSNYNILLYLETWYSWSFISQNTYSSRTLLCLKYSCFSLNIITSMRTLAGFPQRTLMTWSSLHYAPTLDSPGTHFAFKLSF
jgi:hypothetical protein